MSEPFLEVSADAEVPVFRAERPSAPMRPQDVAAVHLALSYAAERLADGGEHIRCVRTEYVAPQNRWISVFVAERKRSVQRAVEIAQLPDVEISEITDDEPAAAPDHWRRVIDKVCGKGHGRRRRP